MWVNTRYITPPDVQPQTHHCNTRIKLHAPNAAKFQTEQLANKVTARHTQPRFVKRQFSSWQPSSQPRSVKRQFSSQPRFVERWLSSQPTFVKRQFSSQPRFVKRQFSSQPRFVKRWLSSQPTFVKRQFSSRWYLHGLHPASQMFPQCCLLNQFQCLSD